MKSETDLLLLPDGRVLIHNLTPAMAALLIEIAPNDPAMRRRVSASSLYLKQPTVVERSLTRTPCDLVDS